MSVAETIARLMPIFSIKVRKEDSIIRGHGHCVIKNHDVHVFILEDHAENFFELTFVSVYRRDTSVITDPRKSGFWLPTPLFTFRIGCKLDKIRAEEIYGHSIREIVNSIIMQLL
ncbi:MAG: hypothetical protein DRP01_08820 [Archaeoglobales archaeon]|nr:MAG: hypothetical protein DRP01_08820 [Archaeoglobales archaeon]